MAPHPSLPPGKNWLFVAGVDRGGTTITTQILNTHPDISVDFERNIVGRHVFLMNQIRANTIDLPYKKSFPAIRGDLESIAPIWDRHLLEGIYEYYGGRPQRYVGDKIPWYTNRIGYLREKFRGARFILNWREPLGTIASWQRAPWRKHLSLPQMVGEYNQLIERIRAEATRGDVMVAYHHSLCSDPATELRRVAEFLEVESQFDLALIEARPPKPLSDADQEYILKHAQLQL